MLNQIIISVKKSIETAESFNSLSNIRVLYLGKSGIITKEMKKLGQLSTDNRKIFGEKLNKLKKEIQQLLDQKKKFLEEKEINISLKKSKIDLTIPAKPIKKGSIHPITQCFEELIQVFSKYGFEVKEGPDIEDDWYNFTALNIDEYHPARQMHDTFYLKKKGTEKVKLLRTQTSPVQIRTMESKKPPFRFISPGKVYRADSDMTHTPMFHQIEGLVIDKNIHMGHLKYVVIDSIKTFFEHKNIKIRFRPSFFPFTEPSAEVDIRVNRTDKWLEILGCGMVHPKVLENVNINPKEYHGFAFGIGVDRLAMLKYNIKDLRDFFEGDIRWLNHYSFAPFDIPSLVGGLTR